MADKGAGVRLVDESGEEPGGRIDEKVIAGVAVELEARIGSARMTVAELMALGAGDCVELDAALNRDVELRLNGASVARGELVAVGDSFGVRITDILK